MSFRGTYALFTVLVVLLAGIAVGLGLRGKPISAGTLLPSLARADVKTRDIARVTIDRPGATPPKLVFERIPLEDRWRMTEPYTGRADSGTVERLVNEFLDARTIARPDQTRNLSAYKLNDPTATITLTSAESGTRPARDWVVKIGNVAADGGVYVVTSDDTQTPQLLPSGSLGQLFKPGTTDLRALADFRSKDVIAAGVTAPADAFRSVKLSAGKAELALKKEDKGWLFETPAGFGAADLEGDAGKPFNADQPFTGVQRLCEALTALKVAGDADFVEEKKSDADFGFDDAYPERLTAEVQYLPPGAKGDTPALVTDKLVVGKPADEKGEKRYARAEGDPVVFKLAAAGLKPIRLTVEPKPGRRPGESLRDHTLVRMNAAAVDAVDVKPAGQTPVELRKAGDPATWYAYGGTEPGRVANAKAAGDLIAALANKRVVEEFPVPAADEPKDKFEARLGLDKPRYELAFWEGGVGKSDKPAEPNAAPAKPEVSTDPKVRFAVGKEDKGVVYVRRTAGDARADLAVRADALAGVKLRRLDYVDPVLPSFEADKAEKLKLVRDGKAVEVERDPADKGKPLGATKWRITAPDDLKGTPADARKVESLLRLMATLRPSNLVAENVGDAELGRFGLKPAAVEAVATLPGEKEPATRGYLFGADSGPSDVYAKQGERGLVFAVPKSAQQTIKDASLRDPLPLRRLDPAKVKSVKFTGWANILPNGAGTLEYEKKDGQWTPKPGTGPADGGKLEAFLRELPTLDIAEFVGKGPPKPDQKLATDAGGLEIAFTQDGEDKPITLVIGDAQSPEKKDTFFATSNQYPNEVFAVRRAEFGVLKASARYFAK